MSSRWAVVGCNRLSHRVLVTSESMLRAGADTPRDLRAWTDLHTLSASGRGACPHHKRHEKEARRRCQDWVTGPRAELWSAPQRTPGRSKQPTPADPEGGGLTDCVISGVCTLVQEVVLRRACAALLQEPTVAPTDEVVASLGLLRATARAPDRARPAPTSE